MVGVEDRKLIMDLSKDKLTDLIFLHLRNMWAVDGLYYLHIEEEFGTEVATKIDRNVWEIMGKIEARKLKKLLKINDNDIKSMINALIFSGWALDLEEKKIIINKKKAIIKILNCRVQNARLKKNLTEFGCKPVRWSFLKAFAKEFNPNIEVKCNICPPDKHPNTLWCEWEFTMS